MREHALGVGPQPCCDQFFLLARGKVNEAVDATSDACDASCLLVMCKQWRRVPSIGRLPGREQTLLRGGNIIKCLPCGFDCTVGSHAQNLNSIEVLCNLGWHPSGTPTKKVMEPRRKLVRFLVPFRAHPEHSIPITWLTLSSICGGFANAVAGVSQDGRKTTVRGSLARWRDD